MSKSLLIDPHKREITVTEIGSYRDMELFCPGGITVAGVTKLGEPLYVDDEGLLRAVQPGFRCPSLRMDDQPLLGFGILQGQDRHEVKEGEFHEWTDDVTTTPEQMLQLIEWMTEAEILAWFRNNSGRVSSFVADEGGITPTGMYGDFLRDLERKKD